MKVLERLVEKGKLIVKKAYADWSRYPAYTAPFHEAAIELIEIRACTDGDRIPSLGGVVNRFGIAPS